MPWTFEISREGEDELARRVLAFLQLAGPSNLKAIVGHFKPNGLVVDDLNDLDVVNNSLRRLASDYYEGAGDDAHMQRAVEVDWNGAGPMDLDDPEDFNLADDRIVWRALPTPK